MAAIIYSAPLCPYCEMAKKLLTKKDTPYKELTIGKDLTKEKAFEEVGVPFKTVPQIIIDGIHIGGYNALLNYFKRKEQINGEPQ